uniref:Cytochrome c n=1 Tax=Polaromonas sp. GM1 TaxID=480424 RepID=L0LGB7_9BURK|nr:cytochrome c [Polaromonas sp. GM1]
MNQKFLVPVVLVLVSLPVPSFANLALAQKNACMACHAVDKKVLGPAYVDVAAKYKGQKDAEAALVSSIKKGGSGKWGAIPMPAQNNLSDADAKALAKWILTTAK